VAFKSIGSFKDLRITASTVSVIQSTVSGKKWIRLRSFDFGLAQRRCRCQLEAKRARYNEAQIEVWIAKKTVELCDTDIIVPNERLLEPPGTAK